MNLLDALIGWLLHLFYRLWYPTILTIGFSNPVTLAFITIHNVLSVSYLWLMTAVGYLLWCRKGWLFPFAISILWTLIGVLFFGACWQRCGLNVAFTAIFTHGWLELAAIFYWINSLRKACLNCHISFQNNWSTWRDWLVSLLSPAKLFHIMNEDVKKAWCLIIRVLNGSWNQLRQSFLFVSLLIFAAAFVETYITPIIVLSLLS